MKSGKAIAWWNSLAMQRNFWNIFLIRKKKVTWQLGQAVCQACLMQADICDQLVSTHINGIILGGLPLSNESLTWILSRGDAEGRGGGAKGTSKRNISLSAGSNEISLLHVYRSVSRLPPLPLHHPPWPLPLLPNPHYHNCVQDMRGHGSDHVILFTPCLALFTNDMPLTAKQTGARRHLLIRAV